MKASHRIIPLKLQPGDQVRIVAPAYSNSHISAETRKYAIARLEGLGLTVSFGQHVEECDEFNSSSVESRVADLHAAFSDQDVKAIMTVLGGYNSNQLLSYLDYELIGNNPKIFCGFSDITALNCAIYAKTGLVTYHGPHYSSLGMQQGCQYTVDYLSNCCFQENSFEVVPAEEWSDDSWYLDQQKRDFLPNDGFWIVNNGAAEGTLIGGNLCTLNLLHGTEYMPDLAESILLLEDDFESAAHTFDRDLQSLMHQPGFNGVRGIVIGRFQKASNISREILEQIIRSKPELTKLPIVANVDFGHTTPFITFPVGGRVSISAENNAGRIVIAKH